MEIFNRRNYRPGSANFEAYRLEFTRNTIQVKPTRKLLVFYGIFAVIGLFILTLPLYAQHDSADAVWAVLIFGLIFFSVGAGAISIALRRCYPLIDLQQKIFFPIGRDKKLLPDAVPKIPLDEVEEISITSRLVSTQKSHYRCYSLNLKCSKEREFLLLCHGSAKAFMRDAKQLSECLNLPISEDDSEEKRRAANIKAAPFLIVFSLFWLGISTPMHLMMWKEKEIIPIVFTGIFVVVGLSILFSAIVLIIKSRQKK